jgi:Gelsolin repeat
LQGAESNRFVGIFPSALTYLPGGAASGLSKPRAPGEPTLYRVSGARRARVSQVPVEPSSLNSGDGFVLDDHAADAVVQWFGSAAPSAALKLRVLDLAEDLRSEEHGGSGQVRAHAASSAALAPASTQALPV